MTDGTDAAPPGRRALLCWSLFDWGNSAFPTVIVTFVFSTYFTRSVAESTTLGTTQWGYALALSGVAVAVLSPVLGAIADQHGRRKPWLATFTGLCAVATAALWLVQPDARFVLLALVLFALANAAFEIASVFYNAMLPGIVSPARLGRASGWAWGLGYLGGLACLTLVLLVLIQTDHPPFGLDKGNAEHIRATALVVAVWFVVFSLPLFLGTPDTEPNRISPRVAVRSGLARIVQTLRDIRGHANIARFLFARMIYIDGLNTLFAFGGIYAAGSFGMDIAEVIRFGIALNVTAGLGAVGFAWVDDWIGAKRTILIALAGLIALGIPLLLVESKTLFWLLGVPLGLFMGPVQAASRSFMARLAPPGQVAEMFGLFALSGRVTAFLGPALLAWLTGMFDSQRAGMATVIVFLGVGALLLVGVREPAKANISGGSGAVR